MTTISAAVGSARKSHLVPVREFTSSDDLLAHAQAIHAKFFPAPASVVYLPARPKRKGGRPKPVLTPEQQAEKKARYREMKRRAARRRHSNPEYRARQNELRRQRMARLRANGDLRGMA